MKIYKTIVFTLCALTLAACGAVETTKSPTETLKTFIEASKNKDVETIKKNLSKNSLSLLEQTAKEQNTTVDELLKKNNGTPIKEMPETRNEKIEGDTATVEVKDKTSGKYETIPFVKEEGEWKIALDVFMQDLMKKMNEEMKPPAQGSSPADSATPPDDGANKSSANKKE